MATEREAEMRIIGDDIGAFGRRAQQWNRLRNGNVREQRALGLDAGDRPASTVAMTGEAFQRAGGSERGAIALIEARAARYVEDAFERRLRARFDQTARARFAQAFDVAQT